VLFSGPGLSAYSGFCFGGSGSAALWGGSGSDWCDSGSTAQIGGGLNVVPVGVVLVRRLECFGYVMVLFSEFCGFERILQVEVSRCSVLFLAG
jgi:hypothetical protein